MPNLSEAKSYNFSEYSSLPNYIYRLRQRSLHYLSSLNVLFSGSRNLPHSACVNTTESNLDKNVQIAVYLKTLKAEKRFKT